MKDKLKKKVAARALTPINLFGAAWIKMIFFHSMNRNSPQS
jgi:hypothetical protein